jgi:hypothetical protein
VSTITKTSANAALRGILVAVFILYFSDLTFPKAACRLNDRQNFTQYLNENKLHFHRKDQQEVHLQSGARKTGPPSRRPTWV